MPGRVAAPVSTGQGPRASSELVQAARRMPSWGWVLLAGLVLIAGASGIADYNLPLKSRGRALWSTVEVLGGIVLFLLAGIAVAGKLRLTHQALSLSDMLFPDRLWVLAFKSLPATRWHICTAVWSLAAALCGVIWVGGLTYWLPSGGPPKAVKVPYAKEIKEAAKKDEEAKGEPTDPEPDPSAQPEKEKPADDPEVSAAPKKSVTKCVIVGYTTKDGDLDGLVVATVDGDELHYAGVVPAGKDPVERKDLLTRFEALKAPAPLFPDLDVRAVWLKPRLSCEVEAVRRDGEQLLKEPELKAVIFPTKPQPVRLPADGDTTDDKGTKEGKGAAPGKAGPATETRPPKGGAPAGVTPPTPGSR